MMTDRSSSPGTARPSPRKISDQLKGPPSISDRTSSKGLRNRQSRELPLQEAQSPGTRDGDQVKKEDQLKIKAKDFANALFLDDKEGAFLTNEGTVLSSERVAGWLGSPNHFNALVLTEYMAAFDFKGQRIEDSFRTLCAKLHMRGESQQLDRILAAFAHHFWDQNKDTVWGSEDNVHSVAFSILVLNTDLSVLDYTRRMTRQQYVQNTLEPLLNQNQNGTSDHAEGLLPPQPVQAPRRTSLLDILRSGSHDQAGSNASDTQEARLHRIELENELREIYNSLRNRPIQIRRAELPSAPSTISLATSTHSSSMGRAPGKPGSNDFLTWRNGFGGSSDRRSLIRGERAVSVMSGRSSTLSMRSDVVGNLWPKPDSLSTMTPPTPKSAIGFASTLSHSIIKEHEDASEVGSIASDVSDEDTLMLHGPPWAKEGTLQVKELYDNKGKKAKNRHWSQLFVVMDRGRLKTFDFLSKKKGNQTQHALGSGNWLDQATPVNSFSLNHSLTQMLPSGYNESRPHIFAINLSAGGVVFFQAGTRDLVDEWVQTCNYWAARVSRGSLLGGVSSVEYGWNRVLPAKEPNNDTGQVAESTSIVNVRIRDWVPPQPSETFATTSAEVQRHDFNQYCQTLQEGTDVSFPNWPEPWLGWVS